MEFPICAMKLRRPKVRVVVVVLLLLLFLDQDHSDRAFP